MINGSASSARDAYERRREPALEYDGVVVSGQRAAFTLVEAPSTDLVGQRRMIDREGARTPRVSGEVDFVRGSELALYLDRPLRSDPSPRGRLVLDTTASHIALDRQLHALLGVRLGAADISRNDISELVLSPSKNRPTAPVEVTNWANSDLDQAKQTAVSAALGAPDFYVVKGPPGTGKTAFIAEFVSQQVRINPRARILIASQTHVALDNAILRIADRNPGLNIVRLGRLGDEFLVKVRPMMLDNLREPWVSEVRTRAEGFIQAHAQEKGADVDTLRAALVIGQIIAAKEEADALSAQLVPVDEQLRRADDPSESADILLTSDERDALQAQRSDLREAQRLVQRRLKDLTGRAAASLGVKADELEVFSNDDLRALAADCFPADTTDRSRLRDLVVLQGEWLDIVGHGQDFEEALLASANVVGATCVGFAGVRAASRLRFDVCIVDEASKATATEVLVPLVKADRWVLVGDQRQLPPFQDEATRNPEIVAEFQLDRTELGRTLFDRLVENVDPSLVAFLGVQHRMTKAIGDLVSQCFYEGQIVSAEDAPEPLSQMVLGRPVTWVTTERRDDRRERPAGTGGLSFANPTEAAAVLRILRSVNSRLAWLADHAQGNGPATPIRTLVLSGYLSQVQQIERKLEPYRAAMPHLQIEVNTVDSSQGREAELVVLSIVRSNPAGRLGFLEQSTRINVALSRAQQALIILGDAEFCRGAGGPLSSVLDYVGRHPETCVVEELDRWS